MNNSKCTMKTRKNTGSGWLAAALAVLLSGSATLAQTPMGSEFTYQGQLKLAGEVLNDTADFEFTLWDAATEGNPIGSLVAVSNVAVKDGLFTVELDFGVIAFNGEARWLEIDVRSPAGSGAFTTLDPRQPLTAAPYALQTRGIFVDETGNVGIGETNPSAMLDVVGTTELNGDVTINSNLTVDTSTLFVNGGNNRVGIGTTDPERTLHVVGNGLLVERNGDDPAVFVRNTRDGEVTAHFAVRADGTDDGFAYLTDQHQLWTLFLRDGSAGIGTANPSAKLDVAGDVRINDNDVFLRGGTDENHGLGWFGSGKLFDDTNVNGPVLYGAGGGALGSTNGGEKIALSWDNNRNVTIPADLTVQDKVELRRSSTHDHGRVYVKNSSDENAVVMGVTNSGNSYVGVVNSNSTIIASLKREGGVGILYANIKNFAVPNPNDPATDIVYACIEGPEAAMYVRGTGQLVNGRATIELPDHFIALAVEEGMTVQLTPRSFDSLGLATAAQRLSGIEVGELHRGRGNYTFDWEVKAVRRAHQDYQVLRSWTERMASSDLTEEELWESRLRSVEQREQRIVEMEARLEAERAGNSAGN